MLLLLTGLDPIPCPRPRLSKFGAYYPAAYRNWKKQADKVIRGAVAKKGHLPYECPLDVVVLFVVKKPKTTKLSCPKPDIDNYVKSIFDACNGIVWKDDALVHTVKATKLWDDYLDAGIYLRADVDEGTHPVKLPAA